MKTIAVLMLLFVSVFAAAAVEVDPEQAVIVVAKNADGTVRFAASELQKYLHMITGDCVCQVLQIKKSDILVARPC